MEVVKAKDPGTLRYECFVSEDGNELVFLETYADSEAVLAHSANVADAVGDLMSMAEITSLEMFGDPSAQVRGALEPMGTKFYPFVNGLEG